MATYRGTPPKFNLLPVQVGTGDGTATPINLTYNPGLSTAIIFAINGSVQVPALNFSLSGQTLVPVTPITLGATWIVYYLGLHSSSVAAIYDIAGGSTGAPAANATLLTFAVVRDFSLPANLLGSSCVAGIAAAASTTISINKNGVSIGTMNFAIGATTATFILTATYFVPGDILTVVAPASPDNNLADIGFTLVGTV